MERNRFVDTLKGVFIIFVIMLHFPYETGVTNRFLFPFWVSLAVPGFMFISGYVSALSFKRKDMSIKKAYEIRGLISRLLRFVIPFTMAFFAEWIVFRILKVYQVNMVTYGLRALFFDYLKGGKGQGSYYFPVMIQFVVLFPLIYSLVKRFKFKGLCGCFSVNLLFEVVKTLANMEDGTYRLLVFRYLFVIAAGAYLAIEGIEYNINTKLVLAISFLAGVCFVILFSYTSYVPKVITMWSATSFLTGLYVVPVMIVLVTKINKGFAPLELYGKASFNIFLVQMIYYNFIDRIMLHIAYKPILLAFNIVVIGILGICFYYIEAPITKIVTKRLAT